MKDLIKFFRDTNYTNKFIIIYYIITIPALIYHELCHVVFMLLTLRKITKVNIRGFKLDKDDKNVLHLPHCAIKSYGKENFSIVLISIAPLIGIILSIFISPYFFYYLIFSHKISFLSNQDYSNIIEYYKGKKKYYNFIKKSTKIFGSLENFSYLCSVKLTN